MYFTVSMLLIGLTFVNTIEGILLRGGVKKKTLTPTITYTPAVSVDSVQ